MEEGKAHEGDAVDPDRAEDGKVHEDGEAGGELGGEEDPAAVEGPREVGLGEGAGVEGCERRVKLRLGIFFVF